MCHVTVLRQVWQLGTQVLLQACAAQPGPVPALWSGGSSEAAQVRTTSCGALGTDSASPESTLEGGRETGAEWSPRSWCIGEGDFCRGEASVDLGTGAVGRDCDHGRQNVSGCSWAGCLWHSLTVLWWPLGSSAWLSPVEALPRWPPDSRVFQPGFSQGFPMVFAGGGDTVIHVLRL